MVVVEKLEGGLTSIGWTRWAIGGVGQNNGRYDSRLDGTGATGCDGGSGKLYFMKMAQTEQTMGTCGWCF